MDNKTTDKGWEAMREMLDREMPVERRRRFGWWWWSLLLLPLAGYGSWQWLHSPDSPPQIKEASTTQPLASLAPRISNQAATFQSKQETTVPIIVEANNSTNSKVETGLKPRKSNLAFSKTAISKTEYIANPSGILPEKGVAAAAQTQVFENKESANPVSKSLVDLQLISPQPIDFKEQTVQSSHSFFGGHLSKPAKKTAKKHWAFGATSALSTEQFSSINGFSTGLTVDWKFAKKWGLRSGAFYNIHSPQEKYRPVASVLSDDYTSNVDGSVIVLDLITGDQVVSVGGNNYNTDSLGGNVFIPVNRLQRLEVPVSAFWQASRPLKIFAGLSFARTLSTTADRQNYSGDYVLKLADKTAEDDASELSSNELDNWSADAMLGAGLRLGKMFELGFSAKMPLNDFKSLKKASTSAFSNGSLTDEVGRTRERGAPVFSLYGTLFF